MSTDPGPPPWWRVAMGAAIDKDGRTLRALSWAGCFTHLLQTLLGVLVCALAMGVFLWTGNLVGGIISDVSTATSFMILIGIAGLIVTFIIMHWLQEAVWLCLWRRYFGRR